MDFNEIDESKLDNIGTDFLKTANDTFINVNKELAYPPTTLSVGEYQLGQNYYPIPFGTDGNFSCLVGATKSMKTFYKSLLVASYIGQNNYAPNFKTHRKTDKFVLDFDTEQGEWHSQNTFKRVPKIAGEYANYKPFYLRKLEPKERLEFIEWCLMESDYKNNIGFVSIDGAADLVVDVNNLKESNNLTQKFLQWTDITQCHLLTVLHRNFGTIKPTGHLGSSILKKAETVCMLDREFENEVATGVINVSFPYTRSFNINPMSFSIDNDGLPQIEEKQHFL
jgi:hypothetical protein